MPSYLFTLALRTNKTTNRKNDNIGNVMADIDFSWMDDLLSDDTDYGYLFDDSDDGAVSLDFDYDPSNYGITSLDFDVSSLFGDDDDYSYLFDDITDLDFVIDFFLSSRTSLYVRTFPKIYPIITPSISPLIRYAISFSSVIITFMIIYY